MDRTISHLPSPITRLGQDILWTIFSLISDMDAPLEYDTFLDKDLSCNTALDNIISASQVCQSWRYLLLRSPSIWGKVLRLDRMIQLGDSWREKIVERTGNAPLYVKGRIQGRYSDYAFAAELISQNWLRMRKVDARFGRDASLHESLWNAFLRPAPHLMSFKCIFEGPRPIVFSSKDGLLFAGDAPFLQELCTKAVVFIVSAPWAIHLRRLRLEAAAFMASEILDAIKQMLNLEHLELYYISGPPPTPLPAQESIILPKLVDLRLTSGLKIGLPFVYAIKPSDRCALIWASIGIAHEARSQEEMDAIHQVLWRYSEAYFSSKKPALVSLNLNESHFEFSATLFDNCPPPNIFIEHPADESTFCINLASSFPVGDTQSFLLPFSKLDLSTIKKFDFRPVPSLWHLDDKHSEFAAFLKSLTSVETLSTSDYGIVVIQECPKDELILPSLRRWELHNASSEDSVRSFLASRQDLGAPVSVLDLSASQIGDWGFLESFDGMKVVWELDGQENEHICGTGEPERLNFGYQRAFGQAWQAIFN